MTAIPAGTVCHVCKSEPAKRWAVEPDAHGGTARYPCCFGCADLMPVELLEPTGEGAA